MYSKNEISNNVVFKIRLIKDALYVLYIKINKLKKVNIFKKTFIKIRIFLLLLNIIIFNLKINNIIIVINNTNYLSNTYNRINNRFIYLKNIYLNSNNVYFFWYFMNQDCFIKIFVNLTMKNGRKYTSYKNIYSSFFFLKKLIGLQPISILKTFLTSYRFLFDMRNINLNLRKIVIVKPKLLSIKSQFTRSLKHVFNNFNLSNLKIKKKNRSFFIKTSYLILNVLFNENENPFNNMMKKDIFYIKNNFKYIRQMESFSRYLTTVKHTNKKKMWKIKFKSVDKKMKFFRKNKSFLKRKIAEWIDFKKTFLINRSNTHLQNISKLKNKWSL